MIQDFTFHLATKIEFGSGKSKLIGKLAQAYGFARVLLVTDKGLRRTGIVDAVFADLQAAGIETTVFDEVLPNPRSTDCESGAELAFARSVDALVAVGGGSSIDTAKAISALSANPGPLGNLFYPHTVPNRGLPLICIPTTAGTGSEVTMFAVITVLEKKSKESIFDANIAPLLALVDPDLLKSVPPAIAASTGMDALTHAIEAYTCRVASPITDAFALYAISCIAESLRDFVYNKDDASCQKMMLASLMAGVAFGYADVAAVHCLAESLGALYDTPHGVANSIFLPIVFAYNIPANVKKHRDVAAALGIDISHKSDREAAAAAVDYLETLAKDVGIPTLRELGYQMTAAELAAIAQKSVKNVSAASNARTFFESDLLGLLEQALRK